MEYTITYSRRAIKEARNAFLFYKEHSTTIAAQFQKELNNQMDYLRKNPLAFELSKKPFRELFLGKFPYLIIYSIHKQTIMIHSIFHTSRNPTTKP